MQAHSLSLQTPSPPWVGSKGQNIFTESSHGAYQVKGNGTQSTIQAYILSLQTPLTTGWSQTYFLSGSSHFSYHIKGNETQSTMQAHILSLHTPLPHRLGEKVNTFFSENIHVAYQTRGNGAQSTMQLSLWVGINGKK